jgi:hypothetical protein
LAWNLLGFITPGLLLALSGAGIARAVGRKGGVLLWLLVLSGLGLAGAGAVPAQIQNGTPVMDSPWTAGHLIMITVSGVPWAIGAVVLAWRVRRRDGWSGLTLLGAVMAVVAVSGLALNVFSGAIPYFAAAPGLAQRTAFAAYFAWFVIMGGATLTTTTAASPAEVAVVP